MQHRQYIRLYLSADIDSELSASERSRVAAHLADCPVCRQRQSAERALKELLKRRISIVAAPAELRQRIIAALDVEMAGLRVKPARPTRRPLWLGAMVTLAAAAAVLVVVLTRGLPEAPPNSTFDAAVKDYLSSQQGFASAAGLDSLPEFAIALANEFGYAWVWDFSSLGLRFTGARIEHLPDDKVLAYGLYKGPQGSILCINFRKLAYRLPPGGEMLHGVRFYKYKDLFIGVVRYNTVYCLIVSRFIPEKMSPALTVGSPKSGAS
jgi:mycothiol system anti-sigma-R factor